MRKKYTVKVEITSTYSHETPETVKIDVKDGLRKIGFAVRKIDVKTGRGGRVV